MPWSSFSERGALSQLFHSPLSHIQLSCNSMDCSPPSSSVHGTSQARILEWVAIFSSIYIYEPFAVYLKLIQHCKWTIVQKQTKKVFSFSWDIYPKVGVLNATAVLSFTVWGASILFSIVAVPICIPTNKNSTQPLPVSPQPHQSLTVSCLFDNRCEAISHCDFYLHLYND